MTQSTKQFRKKPVELKGTNAILSITERKNLLENI